MLLLDVNVLLAAHRADHPDHDVAAAELGVTARGDEPFTVPSFVWASLLRLATNRRVFGVPSSLGDVFAFIDAVIGQQGFVAAEPGVRHLTLLRQACAAAGASGNLVPDAVLAGLAEELGATVVSFDHDFDRFSVRHRRPGG